MWAEPQTSLPFRLSSLLKLGKQGTVGAPRTHKPSLGTTCHPAVTGLGTLLTFNNFMCIIKSISEIAKSRLKKYSTKTTGKWQSDRLNLFLSDSKPSPPDHFVFHMPGSELDTMGVGAGHSHMWSCPVVFFKGGPGLLWLASDTGSEAWSLSQHIYQ